MQSRETELVLLVGDPHLKVSKIEDAKEFLEKLLDVVSTKKYDKVVILGDLFDTFAVIRSEVLSLWYGFITSASSILGKENLILLVGNHDYAGAKGGTHALEPFKNISTVIDDIDVIKVGGLNCYFIPFKRDNQEFESVVSEMNGSVLFCHQSFNGAKFENGFYDPHGANPESVAHFKKVISGHIHSEQTVGDNIYYPGTPFQHSFGEAGQQKSVVVVEIGKNEVSIVDKVNLDMPKFHVLKFDSVADIKIPKEFNPRDSYKIVASGSPQEIADFWRSEEVKQFRESVKRLVDSIVSKKTVDKDVFHKNASVEEKLDAFIKSKKWKTPQEDLIGRARQFLSE
jgi:DNA repair exonuclease SbcCD nuclease subunit